MTAVALVRIKTSEVVSVHNDAPRRLTLPDVGQVSPAEIGWEAHGFKIVAYHQFRTPSGKVPTGAVRYEIRDGEVHETFDVEDAPPAPPPPRRLVPKSTVLARLTDKQLDAALAILTNRQKERWRSPDHPEVYFDDPDVVAIVRAVGADPAVVLAE